MCKHFYNNFCNSAIDNLNEMIVNSHFYLIASVMENVRLNVWAMLDISDSRSRKIMKAFE